MFSRPDRDLSREMNVRFFFMFVFTMMENCFQKNCSSEEVCSGSPIYLEATPTEQNLVSSAYTQNIVSSSYKCVWIISSPNVSDVISVTLAKLFTGSTSSCTYDYVIVRNGRSQDGQPLRLWCKGSNELDTARSYSSAIYVELVATSFDRAGIFFIMSFSASAKSRVIEGPVEFGALNYILIAVSVLVFLAIVGGVVVLVYREIKRAREKKEVKFKQMLRVRRKGISGMSGVVNRQFIEDDLREYFDTKSTDNTSYTVLSVTPNEDSKGLENTVSTSLSGSPSTDKHIDSASLRRVSFENRILSQDNMSLTSLNIGQKIGQLVNDTSSLTKVSVTSSSDTGV